MQHQRLMPASNIELFNHLFLPSAVIAPSNIKLNVSNVNIAFPIQICSSYDSQPFIICVLIWINLLNRVTMIEKCIFASMTRYTVRKSALNHLDMIILTITKSMGPHIWTFQMNLKHRRNRHNSDWFWVIEVKPRIS